MKKAISSFVLIGIGICLIFFSLAIYSYFNNPITEKFDSKVVAVPRGMSIKEISSLLKNEGLIRDPLFFEWLVRLKGLQLKAGEYQLSPSMASDEILDRLNSGNEILYPVTIPEGLTLVEISEILERKGLINKEKFFELVIDENILEKYGIQAETAEGYLFPETYNFRKGVSEREIVETMLKMFQKKIQSLFGRYGPWEDLTTHQIITLASLIEKETSVPAERPLISAVFHNRLNQGMKLQADPTVIYSLPNFDGNIRKQDLSIESPYNTYRYRGLPPSPISNASVDSVLAALRPAAVNYLYFVSKNNGTHKFSNNLKSHLKAVQKYQLRKG